MTAHSTGPWYFHNDAAGYDELRSPNGEVIAIWGEWPALTKADAELIRSAPELLALLREWRDGLRFVDGVEQPQIMLRPDTRRAALDQRLAVMRDFGDRVERLIARIDGAAKDG